MSIFQGQGYKPARDRQTEERKTALLWLYLASKGLIPDFTEFYKLHHSQTMEEIDREFYKLQNHTDDGE